MFADEVTNALAEIFPNDPPRFMARTPHGYHDTALIRRELEDAGFSRVVIETRAEQSRASSPRLPAVAYCQGTLLRTEIEARDPGKLEAATDYAASAIAARHGSGEVAAKISGTRDRGRGLVQSVETPVSSVNESTSRGLADDACGQHLRISVGFRGRLPTPEALLRKRGLEHAEAGLRPWAPASSFPASQYLSRSAEAT